jgi:hypothetical protein
VAGIYRVRDCTAGFRAIRGSLLRKINLQNLRVQGYAFQVALLYEAVIRSAVIREVPVSFIDRTMGESKLVERHRGVLVQCLVDPRQVRRLSNFYSLADRRRELGFHDAPENETTNTCPVAIQVSICQFH